MRLRNWTRGAGADGIFEVEIENVLEALGEVLVRVLGGIAGCGRRGLGFSGSK
jgi:hypothetical protein